jgi:hypothetical protein
MIGKDLFILGAGFSKAFYNEMPLMEDLNSEIYKKILEKGREEDKVLKVLYEEYIKRRFTDFEEILTYLYQELPWKSETEKHLNKGLYYRITELLVELLSKKQKVYLNKKVELGTKVAYNLGNAGFSVENSDILVNYSFSQISSSIYSDFRLVKNLILRGEVGGYLMRNVKLIDLHNDTNYFDAKVAESLSEDTAIIGSLFLS